MEFLYSGISIGNVYPMNIANLYKADFLDILFDGRNKDYGAYALRRYHDIRVRNAIIGMTSFAFILIGGYVLSNRLLVSGMHIRSRTVVDPITPIALRPIEPLARPFTPPPPATVTPPPANSSIKHVVPVIAHDENVLPEDEVPKLGDIGKKSIGLATASGDDILGVDLGIMDSPGTGGVVTAPETVNRDAVYTGGVEIMPSFPGGDAALSKFLRGNVRYPQMAVEAGVSGTVFVQFIVDWEGNIKDVKVIGARKGAGLEEEAARVVKAMPKWKPGRQNGQPVTVQFNLPVSFRLE